MYITQKEKKEKLHMINKIFSYSHGGIPLGWEGREKGRKGRWLVVGEGENGIRTVENGVRKRYEE